MKRTIVALLGLLLSSSPAFAQEIEVSEPSSYEIFEEQIRVEYANKKPEDIWREYFSNASTLELARDVKDFKNPYYSWGIEEILKREPEPQACGMFLSHVHKTSVKNLVFKKCLNRSYTFDEFRDLFRFDPLPESYIPGFISKVLENTGLSNSQLFDLLHFKSTPELKTEIASRINIGELEASGCQFINYTEIAPGYSEFLESLCEQARIQDVFNFAKSFTLWKIMSK